MGPRGVPWSRQSSHHDDFLLKSCIGFNSFVFRLLRFWERLGRLPNACFAAKQVPGTPPEKLNSDFGAKMGGGATQNRRFGGMRAAAGGKGVSPPSLRES